MPPPLTAHRTSLMDAQDNAPPNARRHRYMELVAPHESVLMRAAWRFCPSERDYAQDLVQDTLVRGYEAYLDGRFREGSNVRAWLLTILTNCFLSDRRRRKRFADVEVDVAFADGASRGEGQSSYTTHQPETALLASVLDEPLEQALATLSEELRLCVILVDIDELTYEEAAQALQIPIGTVRSRLFRARQSLYERLYQYAHDHRRV